MLDELRRIALFSSGVAELTRHRAEQLVRDLVREGEVRRDQASMAVRELMEGSRQGRQELLRFIRAEIQNQVTALGVVTRRDLERLERRIARLETQAKSTGAKKTTRKTSSTRRKTSASRSATTPPTAAAGTTTSSPTSGGDGS